MTLTASNRAYLARKAAKAKAEAKARKAQHKAQARAAIVARVTDAGAIVGEVVFKASLALGAFAFAALAGMTLA